MGPSLARPEDHLPLRQYGGGLRHQQGLGQGPQLMRLLRMLFFFCAHNMITLSACHIARALNFSANALSRNYPPPLITRPPTADSHPRRTQRSPLQPVPGLDIMRLDDTIHLYLKEYVALSTRSTYASAHRHFQAF